MLPAFVIFLPLEQSTQHSQLEGGEVYLARVFSSWLAVSKPEMDDMMERPVQRMAAHPMATRKKREGKCQGGLFQVTTPVIHLSLQPGSTDEYSIPMTQSPSKSTQTHKAFKGYFTSKPQH